MIIYKATNKISNKSYVGLTSKTLKERTSRHYVDARGGSAARFHNALRKYGKTDWSWEILVECDTLVQANLLEIKLIKEYDTFNSGYNSTTGGENIFYGTNLSIEDLKMIELAPINIERSQSYKTNMSESKKAYYESEAGLKLRKSKSQKMKAFWASPEGQKRKEIQRKKCGRAQPQDKRDANGKRMQKIWDSNEGRKKMTDAISNYQESKQ